MSEGYFTEAGWRCRSGHLFTVHIRKPKTLHAFTAYSLLCVLFSLSCSFFFWHYVFVDQYTNTVAVSTVPKGVTENMVKC